MFKKFKKLSSGIIFTGGLVAFLVLLAVILLFQTSDVLDKQVVNKDSLVAGGSTENLQEESTEFPNNTVVLGILVDPFPFTTMLRDWRNAFQAFEPAKISFTQKWQACYKPEFLKRYEKETARENERTDSLLKFRRLQSFSILKHRPIRICLTNIRKEHKSYKENLFFY